MFGAAGGSMGDMGRRSRPAGADWRWASAAVGAWNTFEFWCSGGFRLALRADRGGFRHLPGSDVARGRRKVSFGLVLEALAFTVITTASR